MTKPGQEAGDSPAFPTQPLERDEGGVIRFRGNAIVRFLLDAGPFDMNQLAHMRFTRAERSEFAQLIGYSLSGYGELSYVTDDEYNAAALLAALEESK